MKFHGQAVLAGILAVLFQLNPALAGTLDLAGFVALEPRFFPGNQSFAGQDRSRFSPSAVFEPEVVYEWNDGGDRLTLVFFAWIDADDGNRSHADLREAAWLHLADNWDLTIGLSKVFWGVTESRHLVDIVNQTDAVEDIDGEDKLGQPMVNFNLQTDFGSFGVFVLPGFRARSFPDDNARLRGSLPINGATYESAARERHIDLALRWSHSIGDVDICLGYFRGTSREARLIPTRQANGAAVLTPQYDQIDQLSIDAQLTSGAWLWKLEAIGRAGQGRGFAAAVAGFEYTFFQVLGGAADIGVLAEYQYDGRGATAPFTAADDDIFLGARLALNDERNSSALIGAVIDREARETALFLEAERRLSGNWKAGIEARAFVHVPTGGSFAGIRRDDFLLLRLARYF